MTTTAGAPGVEGRHEYHLELEFLHPIDAKASKISVAPRQIVVMVMKTEEVGRRPLDDSFVRSFVVFPSLLFSFLSASVLDVRRSVSDRELALSFRPYRPHSGPHWPRLLKANGKFPHVKTDFDKWVDEDEEDELDRGATRATEALFLKNFFFRFAGGLVVAAVALASSSSSLSYSIYPPRRPSPLYLTRRRVRLEQAEGPVGA